MAARQWMIGTILGATVVAVVMTVVPSGDSRLIPSGSVERIEIRKRDRALVLFDGDTVLAEYTVSLGGGPLGAKVREGDQRTPEGHYVIDGRNRKSRYHLALRVSYPDADDRRRAAGLGVSPGGDIMIHGLPNGWGRLGALHRLWDWTAGCIAVTDEEIEEIWRLVPDGTPITISP
jgi:murein L,D-transpeptidase YafK